MLCFAITPSVNRRFRNDLATNAQAQLTTRALLTLESPVLEDPALIDPTTGACQGALISKRTLVGMYGLTQSQANSFFNSRITVRLGLSGSARMVESLIHGYGLRLYGDRR